MSQSIKRRIKFQSHPSDKLRVALLVWKFPAQANTYVVNEVLELIKENIDFIIYSLDKPVEFTFDHFEKELDIIGRQNIVYVKEEELLNEHSGWALRIPTSHSEFREEIELIKESNRKKYDIAEHAGYERSQKLILGLAERMKKDGIKFIYSPFGNHTADLAMMINKYCGIPYGFSVHAYDIFSSYYFEKLKAQTASIVFPISDFNKKMLIEEKFFDEKKVHVRRINFRKPDVSDIKEIQPGHPYIFSASRLDEMKGYKYAIEAFHKFSKEHPDLHFYIAGRGDLFETIENQVKDLGLENKVHLLGVIKNEEVLAYVKGCEFTILASIELEDGDTEGLPTFFVESMSIGKPVIGSKLSGIPELVIHDETGKLVEQKDVEGLYLAIKELYEETRDLEYKKAISKKCSDKVEELYDNKKNIKILSDGFWRGAKHPSVSIKFPRIRPKAFGKHKIFDLSLFKTGSTLVSEIFSCMEYKHCGYSEYFQREYNQIIEQKFAWDSNIGEDPSELYEMFEYMSDFDTFSDNPWRNIDHRILDWAFPGSKFIFLERTPDSWIKCFREHMEDPDLGPEGSVPLVPEYEKVLREQFAEKKLVLQNYFKGRPDDLYINDFYTTDELGSLCDFLGGRPIHKDYLNLDFSRSDWT